MVVSRVNIPVVAGAEMSSVRCLREFISERLTAAAEEIFTVFEKTVIQYEEEVARQRRLLDVVLKPELKLHRTGLYNQNAPHIG